MQLDKSYWESRYENNQAAWDAGEITTPLKEYIEQLTNKNLNILIPGAGNSYEAEFLHDAGFKNVMVIDLASNPLNNIRQRIPSFPAENLIEGNFFDHNKKHDLIIEQTFFCALDPSLRPAYAKKMAEILAPGGKVAGVLFDTEFEGGPPFGGNKNEYLQYFEPFFQIKTLEKCYNSIKPRENRELFMILERK
jgi:hypothetical protein